MPRLSALRFLVIGVALVFTACGGSPVSTTTPLQPRALAYAAEADRALDGTGFETLSTADLADEIVGLCTTGDAASDAIARLTALTGDGSGSGILREVLIEGMVQICPSRTGEAAAVDAFVASARSAIAATETDLEIDDEPIIRAGSAVCTVLDADMGAEQALLVAAAALFGVEVSTVADLDGHLDEAQGVALGAVLAAAATTWCPEFQDQVAEYIAGL